MPDEASPIPPPDVEIGGRGYVRVLDGASGKELLLPADAELTEAAAEKHYRRSSEVMALQIERGKAPWQLPRDPGTALPENFARDPRPHRGQNAVWLQAAADHRGYSDPRWGSAAIIESAGGTVRPEERSRGITVLLWREHWQTRAPRVFAIQAYNAEQCDGLPDRASGAIASGLPDSPPPRQLLRAAAVDHVRGATPRYEPELDRIVLPPESEFADEQAFLRAGIRQLGHWTGHQNRLDRETLHWATDQPGTPEAAREELRGEIHAMLAGCRLGIGHEPQRDGQRAERLASALRVDSHEIYRAGSDAEVMLAYSAERARARPPEPPKPHHGFTSAAEMARQLQENPPWERSR